MLEQTLELCYSGQKTLTPVKKLDLREITNPLATVGVKDSTHKDNSGLKRENDPLLIIKFIMRCLTDQAIEKNIIILHVKTNHLTCL